MRQIPGIEAHGGSKSWGIEELWIDLLGEIDYVAEKAFTKFMTPNGSVLIIPVEDALVGRVYAARKWVSGYNESDDLCAKKLMTTVLTKSETVPFDWPEAYRVAASPKYRCTDELNAVRAEVEAELANRPK